MRFIQPTDFRIACALLLAAPLASAGDLNPPAGPPTPTMIPLEQVEPRTPINALPFTINQPGSYYFTQDLAGQAGNVGIVINADDVAIDMRGFTMRGVAGASTGITIANGPRHNIAIYDGVVRDWGASGLFLQDARECHIENVLTEDNANNGVFVGFGGVIKGCHARDNGAVGLRGRSGSSISDSTATGNGVIGILVENSCVVSRCTSRLNGASANITSPYEGTGIGAGDDCVITDCVSTRNERAGIETLDAAVISGCQANENEYSGILAGAGCVITNCAAGGNVTPQNQNPDVIYLGGIITGEGCVVTHCQVDDNKGSGVYALFDSVVAACSATGNGIDLQLANATARGQSLIQEYAEGAGLVVDSGGLIANSSAAESSQAELVAHQGGLIVDSTASNANRVPALRGGGSGRGVVVDDYIVIANTTATRNFIYGFDVNSGNLLIDCAAYRNGTCGLNADFDNYIVNFKAASNGPLTEFAARGDSPIGGIFINGRGNRIADAHIKQNSHGLTITSAENFTHGVGASSNPAASGANNFNILNIDNLILISTPGSINSAPHVWASYDMGGLLTQIQDVYTTSGDKR